MSADALPPRPKPFPHRRWLLLAGAALLLAGFAGLAWLQSPPGFDARFANLHMGMTKAEAHDLLGPPGDRITARAEPVGFSVVGPVFLGPSTLRSVEAWRTDDGDFYLGYGADGRIVALRANPCRQPKSAWRRLADWAERCLAAPAPTMPATPFPLPLPSVSHAGR